MRKENRPLFAMWLIAMLSAIALLVVEHQRDRARADVERLEAERRESQDVILKLILHRADACPSLQQVESDCWAELAHQLERCER